MTCIPKKFTSASVPGSTDNNQFRSAVIKHLRLKDVSDSSHHYVAFSHWHPKISDAHDESKKKGANKTFPRAVSLELGKAIGLTSNEKFEGVGCSPSSYFINFSSATFDSFKKFLSTEFVDQQIVLIASGERPVSLDLRQSLSASAAANSSVIGSDLA